MTIGEDTRFERDLHAMPSQGPPTDESSPSPSREAASAVEPEHQDRVLLTDRHWPGRTFDTVDEILVAPTGIFVVDAVCWSGPVEVTADLLEVNGRNRHAAVTSAHDTAREVALLLAPELRDHVFPVIRLSREEAISGWVKAVWVCSTETFGELVDDRDVVLTDDEVARISADLDGALPSNAVIPAERSRAADLLSPSVTADTQGGAVPKPTWHRSTIGRITQAALGLALVGSVTVVGLHMTATNSASDDTPTKRHQPANR